MIAVAGSASTWRALGILTYHNDHLNSLFQDLHQELVHSEELKKEVGGGGQMYRLQEIVHIIFIIHTVFFRIYINR